MLETSVLAIVGNRMNVRIAINSIQENRARVFRNPNELRETQPTARGEMNPAMNIAIFTTTTNAAIREGVIDGKDIMYVFKTGRYPESPNPAMSNPTWVTAPSPKKRGMLPNMTTAQLIHSKCFCHEARAAKMPKAMTPAAPLNGSSDAKRSAFVNEKPRPLSRNSGMKEKYML